MKVENLAVILASASPRRQELLRSAGVPVEVMPSRIEENVVRGETYTEHVRRLARAKAEEVAELHCDRWILAADTVVVIENEMLGKPRNPREAERMLQRLSGKEHLVATGFCILNRLVPNQREKAIITRVKFKALCPEEIHWYIGTGEPFDKAGGYAIQGRAAFMVEEIHGSYTNVVGLPLCEVLEALEEVGAYHPSRCAFSTDRMRALQPSLSPGEGEGQGEGEKGKGAKKN
jgi:septum formation protein